MPKDFFAKYGESGTVRNDLKDNPANLLDLEKARNM